MLDETLLNPWARGRMDDDDDDDDDEEDETPRKRKEAGGSPMLAERMFKTRTILICGGINQKLAAVVTAQLLTLADESPDKPIRLFINSQGGHVEAGDTIFDMIRFIPAPVFIIGTGWVASAGALIYAAAPRERRMSLPNTRFMLHQPMGGVRGQASDISIEAEEILRIRGRINLILAEATGQPLEQIERDTERNFWMSAERARDYGLVGEVVRSAAQVPR